MNAFIALPLLVRLAVLGAVGVVVGSLVNAGIYSLAWFARPISPWQRPHAKAPPRRRSDFLPVVGWFGLAREAALHGRSFWIRPLLIELACAFGLPLLYFWETTGHLTPLLAGVKGPQPDDMMLQHQFISHAILMALMLVATFIDFDEKTIPDEITIPGTLIGLLLAALWPDSQLPVERSIVPLAMLPPLKAYLPLLVTSTSNWPAWLNGPRGLAIGELIFVGWCAALIPALCTLRRGWKNGVRFYFASIARESAWWKMLILAVLGGAAIGLVWRRDGEVWQALFSALVGLAVGGGMIWSVRIVGRIALQKEAMGFGDVTLMAMIGAFLGWQPCVVLFFLSALLAVVSAVGQALMTGQRDIPYGPYLCAAATIVIVRWPWFWRNFGEIFALGWLLPSVLVVCLALMLAMLSAWRWIEGAIWRGQRPAD